MFVEMLGFCNLFLQQAADSNWKKNTAKTQQTFGPSCFVKTLATFNNKIFSHHFNASQFFSLYMGSVELEGLL